VTQPRGGRHYDYDIPQIRPLDKRYKPITEEEAGTEPLEKYRFILWSEDSSTDEGCEPWRWRHGGIEMDSRVHRCIARKANSTARCRQPVKDGTHVCHFHGGRLPQVRTAIERRKTEAEIVNQMEQFRQELRMGEGPLEDRDPLLVLGDILALTRGDILAIRQALLTVDLKDDAHTGRSQAILKQYGIALDRAARVSESLVKVKQADRSLSMAESTQALDRLQRVAEMGKDPEYRKAAVTVAGMMRERLLALDAQTDDFLSGSQPLVVQEADQPE
jgi:hypothetical protein